MTQSHFQITGLCPNQSELLSDILYIEDIFFSYSATKSQLPPEPDVKAPNDIESSESNRIDLPPALSEPADHAEPVSNEADNPYAKAQQIFLRKVGDLIKSKFIASGSRHIQKANRKCFVIYLEDEDGSLLFLQGTQLQEEIDTKNLNIGDIVQIEKTGQFKKARERSHAKPAVFNITKV
jgi:hypothetical protein